MNVPISEATTARKPTGAAKPGSETFEARTASRLAHGGDRVSALTQGPPPKKSFGHISLRG
jgi:hypothetical protein